MKRSDTQDPRELVREAVASADALARSQACPHESMLRDLAAALSARLPDPDTDVGRLVDGMAGYVALVGTEHSSGRHVAALCAIVSELIAAARAAVPEAEHPAEETVHNWAWQLRVTGEDRRAAYREIERLTAERDELREEVETLSRGMADYSEAAVKAERERDQYACCGEALTGSGQHGDECPYTLLAEADDTCRGCGQAVADCVAGWAAPDAGGCSGSWPGRDLFVEAIRKARGLNTKLAEAVTLLRRWPNGRPCHLPDGAAIACHTRQEDVDAAARIVAEHDREESPDV